MKTNNFEAVKVALKQDRTGYIFTLSIHPDEVPLDILRDFVGARYQVVMVRINDSEQPMDRERELPNDAVRIAGMLCSNIKFQEFLLENGKIFDATESNATVWLREELRIESRAELKTNQNAARHLSHIRKEFESWMIKD
jgi:hypothetical protein